MIIIDKPFASDLLINTIKKNNFPLIATQTAKNMISDESLNWISESKAKEMFKNEPNSLLYSNSENSISWIDRNLEMSSLPAQVEVFKNKIKFRELLKDLYPNYYFKGLKYDELRSVNTGDLIFPFIIKPAVGFFSIAVLRVNNKEEWETTLDKIDVEMLKLQKAYPKEVLNGSDFIIEEIIKGEEYAIDCHFDKNGEAVILHIMHHVFSSESDMNDRVYSTSIDIMELYKDEILKFLNVLSKRVGLKNFPAHIEIRITEDGFINPIEVNPLRFGGWCTSADLTWHAYKSNSYECLLNGQTPNWKEIYKGREGKKYSVIVLNNSSGINEDDIDSFDYDKLENDFRKPLEIRKVDYKKFTIFGFLFVETESDNEYELDKILNSDLKEYIIMKGSK